jgi:hypothetical protein
VGTYIRYNAAPQWFEVGQPCSKEYNKKVKRKIPMHYAIKVKREIGR